MEVIPAIDLRGGLCVRLYQGDYERETVFSEDPVAVAQRWYEQGARRLHIVDLDGAAQGTPANEGIIRAIAQAVPIPLQVGGGIRDLATVDAIMGWGITRVVLGTAAVEEPNVVKAACEAYPEGIVVALDARAGRIAIKGWLEETDVDVTDLAQRMAAVGVPRFLYTDIARDGTGTEPNFKAIERMQQATGRPIIASGGVARLEHLRRLQGLGVEAAIVGRALYTGAINLPDALAAVAA